MQMQLKQAKENSFQKFTHKPETKHNFLQKKEKVSELCSISLLPSILPDRLSGTLLMDGYWESQDKEL